MEDRPIKKPRRERRRVAEVEPRAQQASEPAIQEPPEAAPGKKPTPADLGELRASVASAADATTAIWLSYVFLLFYMLLGVGGITDADLFLERPVQLPFLNIEMPLGGFAYLAPIIFIVAHAYVLLQF